MCKFSRDVIFADDRNPAVFLENHLSTLELHMHCDRFKNFEDLIFMDDKLSAKTAKIMSLENLYVRMQYTSVIFRGVQLSR